MDHLTRYSISHSLPNPTIDTEKLLMEGRIAQSSPVATSMHIEDYNVFIEPPMLTDTDTLTTTIADEEEALFDEKTIRQYVDHLSPLMKSLEEQTIELHKKKIQINFKIKKIEFCLANNRPLKCLPSSPPEFLVPHPSIAISANNAMLANWKQYIQTQGMTLIENLKQVQEEVMKEILSIQHPIKETVKSNICRYYNFGTKNNTALYNAYKTSLVLRIMKIEAFYQDKFEKFRKYEEKKLVPSHQQGQIYGPEEPLRFKKQHQVPYYISKPNIAPKKENGPHKSLREPNKGREDWHRNQRNLRKPVQEREERSQPRQREDNKRPEERTRLAERTRKLNIALNPRYTTYQVSKSRRQ